MRTAYEACAGEMRQSDTQFSVAKSSEANLAGLPGY